MSETRAIKVESCEKCFKGKIYCVYGKELFRGSIHPNCPLPAWPSLSKKTIIKIQKILLGVSEKETGVIIAMARIESLLELEGMEVRDV